jgi:uncharacterized protein YutE (UPF0331/DUF86 family)
MGRENTVPAIVQQMVEAMRDKTNNSNIKYNYMVAVENIRDYCDAALRDYEKNKRK